MTAQKDLVLAYILWFFLGKFGVHRYGTSCTNFFFLDFILVIMFPVRFTYAPLGFVLLDGSLSMNHDCFLFFF